METLLTLDSVAAINKNIFQTQLISHLFCFYMRTFHSSSQDIFSTGWNTLFPHNLLLRHTFFLIIVLALLQHSQLSVILNKKKASSAFLFLQPTSCSAKTDLSKLSTAQGNSLCGKIWSKRKIAIYFLVCQCCRESRSYLNLYKHAACIYSIIDHAKLSLDVKDRTHLLCWQWIPLKPCGHLHT